MSPNHGALKAVDDALGGLVTQLIAAGDLKGKLGSTHLLYSNGALPARRVLVTGLGKEADFSVSVARKAATGRGRRGARDGCHDVHLGGPRRQGRGGLSVADAAEALAEGSLLGAYKFVSYKRDGDDNDTSEIGEMIVLEADANKIDEVHAGVTIGQAVGKPRTGHVTRSTSLLTI